MIRPEIYDAFIAKSYINQFHRASGWAAHPPARMSLVTWLPAHTIAITFRNLK